MTQRCVTGGAYDWRNATCADVPFLCGQQWRASYAATPPHLPAHAVYKLILELADGVATAPATRHGTYCRRPDKDVLDNSYSYRMRACAMICSFCFTLYFLLPSANWTSACSGRLPCPWRYHLPLPTIPYWPRVPHHPMRLLQRGGRAPHATKPVAFFAMIVYPDAGTGVFNACRTGQTEDGRAFRLLHTFYLYGLGGTYPGCRCPQ